MIQIVNTITGEFFFNNKDKLGSFGPSYIFSVNDTKGIIHKTEKTESEVISLIKNQGGYARVVNTDFISVQDLSDPESTYEVSSPSYSAARDFYFFRDMIACVAVSGTISSIYVSGTDYHNWWDISSLMETSFLATETSRSLGVAPKNYAYVDKFYVTEVSIGSLSAISADYYIGQSNEIKAVAGIHDQRLPWLIFPRTVSAATTFNKVLTGALTDPQGRSMSPSVFVEGKSNVAARVNALTESQIKLYYKKFSAKAESFSKSFSSVTSIPTPTYKTIEATSLFYYPTFDIVEQTGAVTQGVQYYCKDADYSAIQRDFDDELSDSSRKVSRMTCVVSDTCLTEYAAQLNEKVSQAKGRFFKSLLESLNVSLSSFTTTLESGVSQKQITDASLVTSVTEELNDSIESSMNLSLDLRGYESVRTFEMGDIITSMIPSVEPLTIPNTVDLSTAGKLLSSVSGVITDKVAYYDKDQDVLLDSLPEGTTSADYLTLSLPKFDVAKYTSLVDERLGSATEFAQIKKALSAVYKSLTSLTESDTEFHKGGWFKWDGPKYFGLDTNSIMIDKVSVYSSKVSAQKRRLTMDLDMYIRPFEYELCSTSRISNFDGYKSFVRDLVTNRFLKQLLQYQSEDKGSVIASASILNGQITEIKDNEEFTRINPVYYSRFHNGQKCYGGLYLDASLRLGIFNTRRFANPAEPNYSIPSCYKPASVWRFTLRIALPVALESTISLAGDYDLSELSKNADTVAAAVLKDEVLSNIDNFNSMTKAHLCCQSSNVIAEGAVANLFLSLNAFDTDVITKAINSITGTSDIEVQAKEALQTLRSAVVIPSSDKIYHFSLDDMASLNSYVDFDCAPVIQALAGYIDYGE